MSSSPRPSGGRADAGLLPLAAVESISAIFKILGDPTRLRLLDALAHGERRVGDLAALITQSESAVSHQLRLLRAARLVQVKRSGRKAYYSLHDDRVITLLRDSRRQAGE